ncbi:tetratricopeptide repeat protein [Beggiatoa leptomitoformis]|uniref:Tetratricopeptide repeat protein n=1 Tax=Beggiatoa leptomitoformis TaxID=288004 RepID=A0A2N9YE51_9GAMM|nr:tetratricopeptide repeat protein [Beggiatoa leptomitoformis]ALG68863.1 tetratricopeptide repeat protein [Beggiatoa leptomitoformis]AUI68768.1 tetratricopeptide repeat protein [Beggiatoa leptomitoformis]
MPAFLSLSVLCQIICVIHAHRTDRRDWIWIILIFSLVGCAFYFFLEMLPDLRNSRTGRRVVKDVLKAIDPTMTLKQRARALSISDNVQNKLNLADECIVHQSYPEAAELYRSCLTGIYKDDPKILLSLAQTLFFMGEFANTKQTLDRLIATNPDFKSQDGHLLYARALEQLGDTALAIDEYQVLASYYSGYEAKCRYGLLLKRLGRTEQARAIFAEIGTLASNLSKGQRKLQKEWIDIARENMS